MKAFPRERTMPDSRVEIQAVQKRPRLRSAIWRPTWRSLAVLGIALSAAAACWAQVTTTSVQDTIYNADGTTASGTILVSWPAFVTASGQTVPQGSTTAQIGANGQVSLNLAPNVGATPAGSYYTAVYHLTDGTVSKEYWVIPSTTSTSIAAIRSLVMPASVAVPETASIEYVTAQMGSYLPLNGGTLKGALQLNGDPQSAMQAATKNYVDASVAPFATAFANTISSAPSSSQVVQQPAGTSLSSNVLQGKYFAKGFQAGGSNHGIATLTSSSNCGATGSTGQGGCTIVAEPDYSPVEQPTWPGEQTFGNNPYNYPWPMGTHFEDLRQGTMTEDFENPIDEYNHQYSGILTTSDFTLPVPQWPQYAAHELSAMVIQNNDYDGGSNFDNYFGYGQPAPYFKPYYYNTAFADTTYTPGQNEALMETVNCHSVGDCLAHSIYLKCDGGWATSNDEGCHGGDFDISEDPVELQGTVIAMNPSANTVTVNVTTGAGTQGASRFLIDTQPGKVISGGPFTGFTDPAKTGPSGDSEVTAPSVSDSAANWPVSTMIQICDAGANNGSGTCAAGQQPTGFIPSQSSNVAPGTVTVGVVAPYTIAGYSGLPAGFCNSTDLQSANASAACYMPATGTGCLAEQEAFETVSYSYNQASQTITLNNLRFPHMNGAIFSTGGLCQYAAEETADDYAIPGSTIRQIFPIIGSVSPTQFYYWSLRPNIGYTNAILGVSNAVNGSGADGGGFCFNETLANFQLQADGKTVVAYGSGGNLPNNQLIPINGLTVTISTPTNASYGGTLQVRVGTYNGTGDNQISYVLPASPSGTVPTSGTISYCNMNYNLYPAAEAVSVYNAASKAVDGTFTLSPNTVNWTAGDSVEQPHYTWILTSDDIGHGIDQFLPRPTNGAPLAAISYNDLLAGNGITGFQIANNTSPNKFLGYGGTHEDPGVGIAVTGIWGEGFATSQPPDTAVLDVQNCKPVIGCNNPLLSNFNVLQVPGSTMNYDPNLGVWTFSGNYHNLTDAPPANMGGGQSLVNVTSTQFPVAMYGIAYTYGGQVSWTWTPSHPEPNVMPLVESMAFSTGNNSASTLLSEPTNVADTIDCGGGFATSNCTFNAGSVNATAAVSAATVAASGAMTTPAITVGGGSKVSEVSYDSTGAVTPVAIAAQSCGDQTFPVTGLQATDNLGSIHPPGALGNVSVNGYASAAGVLTLHFCNVSTASVSPPAGAYMFLAMH